VREHRHVALQLRQPLHGELCGRLGIKRGDRAPRSIALTVHEAHFGPGERRKLLREWAVERETQRHPGDHLWRTQWSEHDLVGATADQSKWRRDVAVRQLQG